MFIKGHSPLTPQYASGLDVPMLQYNGLDLFFLCANTECVSGWSVPMHAHKKMKALSESTEQLAGTYRKQVQGRRDTMKALTAGFFNFCIGRFSPKYSRLYYSILRLMPLTPTPTLTLTKVLSLKILWFSVWEMCLCEQIFDPRV